MNQHHVDGDDDLRRNDIKYMLPWSSLVPLHTIDKHVPVSFSSLDHRLRQKLRQAGCRSGEMKRTEQQAQLLYCKVPALARANEKDLNQFLFQRDASHIQAHGGSVHAVLRQDGFNIKNAPENVEWELSSVNRARKSNDMTWAELTKLRRDNEIEAYNMMWSRVQLDAARCGFSAFKAHFPLEFIQELVKLLRAQGQHVSREQQNNKIEVTWLLAGRAATAAMKQACVVGFAAGVTAAGLGWFFARLPGAWLPSEKCTLVKCADVALGAVRIVGLAAYAISALQSMSDLARILHARPLSHDGDGDSVVSRES